MAVISIGGLIKGDAVGAITSSASTPVSSTGFLSALIVVIFAFDGWMVAPSIAHEIKNPKRDLPLALMIAPLMITAVYLAYFLGASALVSPEQLASGTDPLQIVATETVWRYRHEGHHDFCYHFGFGYAEWPCTRLYPFALRPCCPEEIRKSRPDRKDASQVRDSCCFRTADLVLDPSVVCPSFSLH